MPNAACFTSHATPLTIPSTTYSSNQRLGRPGGAEDRQRPAGVRPGLVGIPDLLDVPAGLVDRTLEQLPHAQPAAADDAQGRQQDQRPVHDPRLVGVVVQVLVPRLAPE